VAYQRHHQNLPFHRGVSADAIAPKACISAARCSVFGHDAEPQSSFVSLTLHSDGNGENGIKLTFTRISLALIPCVMS
jgi:hypothetical protein